MKRWFAAFLLAGIAAAVFFVETLPFAARVRSGWQEWLGAYAASHRPVLVTAIQTKGAVVPLDAALILRAVLHFEPRGILFLDPVQAGEGGPLLQSKMSDARIPVVFAGEKSQTALPHVTGSAPVSTRLDGVRPSSIPLVERWGDGFVMTEPLRFLLEVRGLSAGAVSGTVPGTLRAGPLVAPVDGAGRARINPLAADYVKTIDFGQLILRTERSEQGEISADLATLFRGRLLVVKSNADPALPLGIAALANHLLESDAKWWPAALGVLLAASLPWWSRVRSVRVAAAVMVVGFWLLAAQAVYQEFCVLLPLSFALLLPVLACFRFPKS